MPNYEQFFLNSGSSVVQLETLEISHESFSKVYRVVRNATNGITLKLENNETHFFQYYPLQIEKLSASDDLDQSLKITLGDLGEIVPDEISRARQQNKLSIKPTVKYRTYRSDDLNSPMFGPVILEISNFVLSEEGATFEAKAPSLNINKTGLIYDLDSFPMLRGFL